MKKLMKTFINAIWLMFFSKALSKIDNFIRIVLILNIVSLILDVFNLNLWMIVDLFFVIYFTIYLYFTYINKKFK